MLWSNSGHGGLRTAEYLKNNLFKNLSGHPDFINDPKTAIGMKLVNFSCYYVRNADSKFFFIHMGNELEAIYISVFCYS